MTLPTFHDFKFGHDYGYMYCTYDSLIEEDFDHKTDEILDPSNFLDEIDVNFIKDEIAKVLETLTDRERKVIIRRFGLADGKTKTLDEVGKEFNVTRERIRQIEAKALRKLRKWSRAEPLLKASEGIYLPYSIRKEREKKQLEELECFKQVIKNELKREDELWKQRTEIYKTGRNEYSFFYPEQIKDVLKFAIEDKKKEKIKKLQESPIKIKKQRVFTKEGIEKIRLRRLEEKARKEEKEMLWNEILALRPKLAQIWKDVDSNYVKNFFLQNFWKMKKTIDEYKMEERVNGCKLIVYHSDEPKPKHLTAKEYYNQPIAHFPRISSYFLHELAGSEGTTPALDESTYNRWLLEAIKERR